MDPFADLLTQPSGPQVAPETLEMLGRQASQLFQSQGVPLNQAITGILANHPELGNEHVKRIVEFANTVTFQEMFQNSTDKNVHFDVADPGVILRDLKDGGTPAHDGKTLAGNNGYRQPPAKPPVDDELERAFNNQFTNSLNGSGVDQSADMGKMASLRTDHEKHADPVDDVYDTHVRLQATREKLAASYETMNGVLRQAQDDFYRQVRHQVLDPDGSGLGGVVSALEKIAEHDIVEALMMPVTERLLQEGVRGPDMMTSLKKTAGVVPNLEHPLFAIADSIVKVAAEMVVCSKAIDGIDANIEQTGGLLKRAGALTTGVKNAIKHKGHVPSGIRQRFPRD